MRERIFKLGDIRDPITGELVVAKEYRKQMDEVSKSINQLKLVIK